MNVLKVEKIYFIILRFKFIAGGGKIAGSNTLWICAAVGEFVILCIVIELILYYKGHGLMYKVSERLKTHNSFKQVANSGMPNLNPFSLSW